MVDDDSAVNVLGDGGTSVQGLGGGSMVVKGLYDGVEVDVNLDEGATAGKGLDDDDSYGDDLYDGGPAGRGSDDGGLFVVCLDDCIAVGEDLVDGATAGKGLAGGDTAVIGLDNGVITGNGLIHGGLVREGLDDGIVDKEFSSVLDIGSVVGKGSSDGVALVSVLDDGGDVGKRLASGGALFKGFDGTDGLCRGCSLVEVGSKGDSSSCLVVFSCRLLFVSLDNFFVRGGSAAMVVLVCWIYFDKILRACVARPRIMKLVSKVDLGVLLLIRPRLQGMSCLCLELFPSCVLFFLARLYLCDFLVPCLLSVFLV